MMEIIDRKKEKDPVLFFKKNLYCQNNNNNSNSNNNNVNVLYLVEYFVGIQTTTLDLNNLKVKKIQLRLSDALFYFILFYLFIFI